MAIDWKKFIKQHHIKNLTLQEQLKLFRWENAYSEKPHQQQLKEDFTNTSTSTPGRTGRGGDAGGGPETFQINYLVLAGGAGAGGGSTGGGGYNFAGGGGGAGGLLTGSNLSISTLQPYSITVGAGGAGGLGGINSGINNVGNGGNDSVANFTTTIITAISGGAGGGADGTGVADDRHRGHNGGSGGGQGGFQSRTGNEEASSGTPGQGNAGGFFDGLSSNGHSRTGGGGGGAGSAGTNNGPAANPIIVGFGGSGSASDITGTEILYAGGGQGGQYSLNLSNHGGGDAGGGRGGSAFADNSGSNGTAGLGAGGGGGNRTFPGGNGGSGVVILRYPSSKTLTLGSGLTTSTAADGVFNVTTITAGTDTIRFN